MALFTSVSNCNQTQKTFLSVFITTLTLFNSIFNKAESISFNFSTFPPNLYNLIDFQRDAFSSNGVLQLTKNQLDGPITSSVGRASYGQRVKLWDKGTKQLTDFTTHFSFVMKAVDETKFGDGLSFFIAPFESQVPENSSGGYLGLFNRESAFNTSKNQIVAVEFDSFMNEWDPSSDHVGINVNSIESVKNVTWRSSIKNGSVANAWISYNSTSKNLSVFLTYANNPTFDGNNSSLSHVIDLRDVLPEFVRIGFSAATGQWFEIHNILSWSFDSNLDSGDGKNIKVGLGVGLSVGFGSLTCVVGLLWFTFWRKRKGPNKGDDNAAGFDVSMDDEEFEKGTGPKRFTYKELSNATNGFEEEGKLGEGGFGGVYKGFLHNLQVAVKRVSKGSRQGKKEYISEVRIISRLRHRNLVQLLGWCHEQGELLLVYEYMPNGSLDSHLFGKMDMLTWTVRYKVALGLASALLYLHEEWEQCVVHRDIKSSNVMLDANFNAKLGDFGLARLVDHELGSQTTVLAGTMGYLAPECVTTGETPYLDNYPYLTNIAAHSDY